ncbi:FAD-binding oxidoreductase [Colwellia sp. D2M02]|uniref:FAD-binding and (Fe-S)-binding domain-containing protein n=1 Tax=Colwellia sp. D2M02 TaxID=2841562 RepID=UPI001C08830C|nr:FAD-binding and (Fe-S)-binding domain-containing protein [Colwellia sp. D2M02]MBU2891776.1 FAD-binding oxidoreductase [Colwellia sp. D2M02]
MIKNFTNFLMVIKTILTKENIIDKDIQRFAYGTDASFYRLVPKVVLRVDSQQQLSQIMRTASDNNVAVTFRAAGTSLSGQAITDSVLIILSRAWQGITILDSGDKVCLQPGVIGASANKALSQYHRKIGPDPASINSCKVGGIAANNSSGMCCGVKDNSYHTLADIKLIFADGSTLDTADSDSIATFKQNHATLINGLMAIAADIQAQPELLSKIQHKYRLKNTTGYGVNALVEFSDPIDIISHLMIGSEGTLAFIADITYHTVKVMPHKATGLYVFDDINVTCQLVNLLANEQVEAIELMDSRALNSVKSHLAALMDFDELPNNSAALLIEFSADSTENLHVLQQKITSHLNSQSKHLLTCREFTTEQAIIEALWKIRKGTFPAVGAHRQAGTTVIIEDVALPLARLAQGIADLHQLFDKYHYDEAIIFGHALAGNLHFVFTQAFDSAAEVARYQNFMDEVTQLIAVEYQGSLKAEHGTGRNMAPFVELEWGTDIYQMMRKVKQLFDPLNILNPGVIINDDDNAHISHLKTMPTADDIIDKCIECGFCESVCPSENYTLTPRQRITLWRHIKDLEEKQTSTGLNEQERKYYQDLISDYQHFGIDSCAATGLCGQECPVGINTGEFIKSLRAAKQTKTSTIIATKAAAHFSGVSQLAKVGLNATALTRKTIGEKALTKSFAAVNKLSANTIPLWYPAWPKGAETDKKIGEYYSEKVIYIPACANRIFATDNTSKDQRPIQQVMRSVLNKARVQVVIPENINKFCCGMPWASKGLPDIAQQKADEFIAMLMACSEQGKWPIVTDASPCALTLDEANQTLKIYEASEFIAQFVLDKLNISPSNDPFMLHKTCSSQKLDGGVHLMRIAQQCSTNIVVPNDINCCGFAGDKGFFVPELNKSALQPLKAQIPSGCQRGLSNSRTCEIGLSAHSDISYQSFLYLLDEVSEPL